MDTRTRFERILLATEGSEASRAAIDATTAIAKSPTAKGSVSHDLLHLTELPVLVAERVQS